jgi:hypothetical protein
MTEANKCEEKNKCQRLSFSKFLFELYDTANPPELNKPNPKPQTLELIMMAVRDKKDFAFLPLFLWQP